MGLVIGQSFTGKVGNAFSQTLAYTGGWSGSWAATGLPAGLDLRNLNSASVVARRQSWVAAEGAVTFSL